MKQKTIAAISTPHSVGGIGIVRLSGSDAREIASKIFIPHSKQKSLMTARGYTALYGRVHQNGEDLDEAIALVFAAPKSYTGEDVVEISCHGGLYLMQQVLRAAIDAGAVPAQAGEFTKRAFLNGKLSLTQAEGVMDLISSQGKQAAKAALSARDGALFHKIDAMKQQLVSLSGHIAAWIDFPEEDVPELEESELADTLHRVLGQLNQMLAGYDVGQMIKNGVETAIVGKPNVGKSTLMNLLSGTERSIVTDIPGTTRDVIENTINLGDIVLRLFDTAGIRETDDPIEQVGVALAKKKIDTAKLILAVFDYSIPLSEHDRSLILSLKDKPCIAIINKTDLNQGVDSDWIESQLSRVVYLSAANREGTEQLIDQIRELLGVMHLDLTSGLLANERQRICGVHAAEFLNQALASVQMGMTLDAVGVEIDSALECLMELTGEQVSESVIDHVFEQFCVGK